VEKPSSSAPSTPMHPSDDDLHLGTTSVGGVNSSDEAPSESDSDIEPDQMLTKFLDLQSRLYNINPDLVDNLYHRQRKPAHGAKTARTSMEEALSPPTLRILSQIKRIKSDILFDKDEANREWNNIRLSLAKEDADRRRLNINEPRKANMSDSLHTHEPNNQVSNHDTEEESIFGDFFSSLPETTMNSGNAKTTASVAAPDGSLIEIRDFGQWSGIGPRRVLEEACKARSG